MTAGNDYDLEIEKAISSINSNSAKRVLLQLPDGLKPKAKDIQDSIIKGTKAEIYIWAGSCFGACDIPIEVEKLGVDMIIQWGHSAWKY